ncbi:MAG: DUF1540 domain-containing protein [Clostridium sp.]
MPKLNCSAQNCINNFENCCCINQINVAGAQASVAQSTCCENFQESKGSFTNNYKTPNTNLSISCEANNCIHNCNNSCEANDVNINGVSACAAEQTACSSFCSK